MLDSVTPRVKLTIGALGAAALLAWNLPRAEVVGHVNVAFVGNSMLYVNDMPRLFQALTGDRIYQNSCLHGSLNLMSVLKKGNGMYLKWSNDRALIPGVDTAEYSCTNGTIFDFGACSVPQLLFGEDENLSVENENGVYINDGKNPCFEDQNYLPYLRDTYHPSNWDFIVLNDHSVYPGVYTLRQSSILVLKEVYGSMLLELGSRPVFLATHAYDKSEHAQAESSRTITLGNVSEFTSRVYYGCQMYVETMAAILPTMQEPILAPSGLAFLVVWEEHYAMWKNLMFDYDGFHPSPYGSYLEGCVLYASMFGRMPPLHDSVEDLFSRSRAMHINVSDAPLRYPTLDEANYLRSVAKRVVLQGFKPKSLLDSAAVRDLEQAEFGSYQYWMYTDDSV